MREVCLVYYDEAGRERRVSVDSRRFSIGRMPENDLAIENTNLSRRHALIESFADGVELTDCGSQNGTKLNGQLVTGMVRLRNHDLITLGDDLDLTVEITEQVQPSAAAYLPAVGAAHSGTAFGAPTAGPAEQPAVAGISSATTTSGGIPRVVWIAPLSAIVLVIAVVIIAVIANGGPGGGPNVNRQPTPRPTRGSTPEATAEASEEPTSTQTPISDPEADRLELVRTASSKALLQSTRDTKIALPQEVVVAVASQVAKYNHSSTVAGWLRIARTRKGEFANLPKNVIPAQAIFAAMAMMDRDGSGGDLVTNTAAVAVTLSDLKLVFDDANMGEALVGVAALDFPKVLSNRGHPLNIAILKHSQNTNDSAAIIRTPWYLKDKGDISPRTYDLVIRFLALGAVAQNPTQFGVEAEPLTF